MNELTFGLLASGKLGAVCVEQLINKNKVLIVFTDKSSEEIINICNKYSIPVYIGNPRSNKVKSYISKIYIDVLFSINYMFIVNPDILNFPKKYAINLHGSLLPKYRGRTPHVWAIINNEKETGITAHIMSENVDEGDIIYQEKIEISDVATGASLLSEFEYRYPQIIFQIINQIENNSIKFTCQDNTKATYFERRKPNDGEINWDWQKERIHNWVRALSKPYPGAFTYYHTNKIIINKLEFCDLGFHQNDVNGKILEYNSLLAVKTSNGVVVLTDIETNCDVKFEIGEEFKCKIFTLGRE